MTGTTIEPLEEQCEWTRESLGDRYVFELTDDHRAELDAALEHAEAHTDDVLDIEKRHFPLPTLGPKLDRIKHDLIDGVGVALIRGVPVERYGKDRASSIYWGIGTHLGLPWPQNAKGHLLGDVTDQGKTVDDPTSRGIVYQPFATTSSPAPNRNWRPRCTSRCRTTSGASRHPANALRSHRGRTGRLGGARTAAE